MFRSSNLISLVLAIGWNAAGIVRLIGLLLWEIGAIVVDLARALFGNLDLKREWEFIPSRLGVGIVLQELMTMAACVDAARGLPVIQLNFLSYDERANSRSRFTICATSLASYRHRDSSNLESRASLGESRLCRLGSFRSRTRSDDAL